MSTQDQINVGKEKKKPEKTEIQSDDQGGTQHCQQAQTSKVAKDQSAFIRFDFNFHLGGNALRSRTFARTRCEK